MYRGFVKNYTDIKTNLLYKTSALDKAATANSSRKLNILKQCKRIRISFI